MGDEYELTGPGWSGAEGYPKTGLRVRIDRASPSGRMWFTYNRYAYFIEAEGEWAAKKIEPAPRKRLRDYTDLRDGDVVVIAGVEFTATRAKSGLIAITHSRATEKIYTENQLIADMFVDEVRRAKRIHREVVLRENPNGSIKIGGLSYTKVDEREVEE